MVTKNIAMADRIVVTGVGPLCSLGKGKDEVWDSVLNSRLNLVRQQYCIDGKKWDEFYIHKIRGFDINDFNLPRQSFDFVSNLRGYKKDDIDLNYFLAITKLALDDSGLKYDLENNDIGLVLSSENPGMDNFVEDLIDSSYAIFEKMKNADKGADKVRAARELYNECDEAGYSLQTFSYLYSVAKVFDIHGYSLFINNACASGLFAIEAASNQLRSGINSAVVVAACDNPTKIYKYEWFKKKGLYAEDGKTRPFSSDKSGIVFGDGGAAIVLETLEHALKRKARIYGEYLGGGFSLEGWKITVPNITDDFYARSFNKALEKSRVKPEEIDFINPHGVGMRITDTYEAGAINAVFGHRKPLVSAFKPLVGHNLGGSALLETAIALLSLNKNMIPATLNCENMDKKLNIDIVRENKKAELSTFAKMSCGFAGFNGVCIFQKIK